MPDDVSETVIAMMAAEIVSLREALTRASSSSLGNNSEQGSQKSSSLLEVPASEERESSRFGREPPRAPRAWLYGDLRRDGGRRPDQQSPGSLRRDEGSKGDNNMLYNSSSRVSSLASNATSTTAYGASRSTSGSTASTSAFLAAPDNVPATSSFPLSASQTPQSTIQSPAYHSRSSSTKDYQHHDLALSTASPKNFAHHLLPTPRLDRSWQSNTEKQERTEQRDLEHAHLVDRLSLVSAQRDAALLQLARLSRGVEQSSKDLNRLEPGATIPTRTEVDTVQSYQQVSPKSTLINEKEGNMGSQDLMSVEELEIGSKGSQDRGRTVMKRKNPDYGAIGTRLQPLDPVGSQFTQRPQKYTPRSPDQRRAQQQQNHRQNIETSQISLPKDPSTTLSPVALEQLRFDILARLAIPHDYPMDPLDPIQLPPTMDLEGFLELSTGSTKKVLRDNRQFLEHEVIWCADRPYHGYIFEPRLVSRPSIASPYLSASNNLQPPQPPSLLPYHVHLLGNANVDAAFSDSSSDGFASRGHSVDSTRAVAGSDFSLALASTQASIGPESLRDESNRGAVMRAAAVTSPPIRDQSDLRIRAHAMDPMAPGNSTSQVLPAPILTTSTGTLVDPVRRWVENTNSAVMRKRSIEVFYNKNGDWFYVGTFKSYPLPDMTSVEFEELPLEIRANLIQSTVDRWPADPSQTTAIEREVAQLYEEGKLKVACVGLQCMGFNYSLSRIMLEQSRRMKLGQPNGE
ncbi:hypothetical protein DL93DRAFT_2164586 [Clavulina sp. PMI_390]|nr:hypothetical protein DL93DRAFT_2164586 [Clavulina sp. PMI_390]